MEGIESMPTRAVNRLVSSTAELAWALARCVHEELAARESRAQSGEQPAADSETDRYGGVWNIVVTRTAPTLRLSARVAVNDGQYLIDSLSRGVSLPSQKGRFRKWVRRRAELAPEPAMEFTYY